MAKVVPLPLSVLVEWIKRTYEYKGVILIGVDGDLEGHEVNMAIDELDYLDVMDSLASTIYIMKAKSIDGDFDDELEELDDE